jgi:trk system potassium uptake protein
LSKDVVQSVLGFMILYMLTFAVFSLGLCAAGLDIMAALSSSAAALSNVAHGLGADVGPLQSYSALPDAAKWLLSFEMLLGRLELLARIDPWLICAHPCIFLALSCAFWRALC